MVVGHYTEAQSQVDYDGKLGLDMYEVGKDKNHS
jgi:hypothetical protein